jgi:hypothetical protein
LIAAAARHALCVEAAQQWDDVLARRTEQIARVRHAEGAALDHRVRDAGARGVVGVACEEHPIEVDEAPVAHEGPNERGRRAQLRRRRRIEGPCRELGQQRARIRVVLDRLLLCIAHELTTDDEPRVVRERGAQLRGVEAHRLGDRCEVEAERV